MCNGFAQSFLQNHQSQRPPPHIWAAQIPSISFILCQEALPFVNPDSPASQLQWVSRSFGLLSETNFFLATLPWFVFLVNKSMLSACHEPSMKPARQKSFQLHCPVGCAMWIGISKCRMRIGPFPRKCLVVKAVNSCGWSRKLRGRFAAQQAPHSFRLWSVLWMS